MTALIVTDAWHPQVNGVVNTLSTWISINHEKGRDIMVMSPDCFKTTSLPGYKEIKFAYDLYEVRQTFKHILDTIELQAIHIAVEGPLGLVARNYCKTRGIPFTTSYHTKFPEYIKATYGVPTWLTYPYYRWFHNGAERTLVTTQSMKDDLTGHGLKNLHILGRGVDTEMFHPSKRDKGIVDGFNRPTLLYVGRISKEKNLEAFLDIELPGRKIIIGDGPERKRLEEKYPNSYFTGMIQGELLARWYASADVFVFPSKTDTFGLVNLEAMASGLPVAAYPVSGPKDIIQQGVTGYVHEDLKTAIQHAILCRRRTCREYAETQSWETISDKFWDFLVQF